MSSYQSIEIDYEELYDIIESIHSRLNLIESKFEELGCSISKQVSLKLHYLRKMQSKINKNLFKNHRSRYNLRKLINEL